MKTQKKIFYTWWVALLFWAYSILSFLSPCVYATWEVSLSQLRESVTLSNEDTSLINAAIKKVETLQTDIETVTAELFALDEIEKAKDPNLSTSYRQARMEMVKVISSINSASAEISISLKKLIAYQKQMRNLIKQLREAQISSEKAREYLNDYMTLLYKMQLKIYDQDWEDIDDIRLFINSDNFNETFVGNDLLSAMTVQLSDLLDKNSQEEIKKQICFQNSEIWKYLHKKV